METETSRCPFRGHDTPNGAEPPSHAAWPPGPSAGLTGWGLLLRMKRDLLGSLAEWQAAYGDVVHLRTWPEHQVMLSDPGMVRELLTRHHDALIRWERGIRVFSRMHGGSVLIAEGSAWRARRRALQPAFSARSVEALVPTVAATTAEALAGWPASHADWSIDSAFTSLAMDVILRSLFSAPIGEDARAAEGAVHDLLAEANAELYWPMSAPTWLPWKGAQRRALRLLHGLIEHHLQARLKLDPAVWPDDVLTRLLNLHRQDAAVWPLQAVRDECMTAFLAGHETTAASLSWWAWCMATHPAAQHAARQEVLARLGTRAPEAADLAALPRLSASLHESLRLYPAAPVLLSRRCVRPITLGRWHFPARTMFVIPVWLIQRDPRWFPEPEAFRPERFARAVGNTPGTAPRGAFMPFGDGPRICLGQHLASAEMTVIAAMLLQRYTLKVPPMTPPPRPDMTISLRPREPLRVALAPAEPGAR